jgi:hypothetical protein
MVYLDTSGFQLGAVGMGMECWPAGKILPAGQTVDGPTAEW